MTSSQTLRTPERHRGRAVSMRYVPEQQSAAMDDSPPAVTLARAISEAAYYRAEDRGFEPGHELEDWIEAERQVTAAYQGEADSAH